MLVKEILKEAIRKSKTNIAIEVTKDKIVRDFTEENYYHTSPGSHFYNYAARTETVTVIYGGCERKRDEEDREVVHYYVIPDPFGRIFVNKKGEYTTNGEVRKWDNDYEELYLSPQLHSMCKSGKLYYNKRLEVIIDRQFLSTLNIDETIKGVKVGIFIEKIGVVVKNNKKISLSSDDILLFNSVKNQVKSLKTDEKLVWIKNCTVHTVANIEDCLEMDAIEFYDWYMIDNQVGIIIRRNNYSAALYYNGSYYDISIWLDTNDDEEAQKYYWGILENSPKIVQKLYHELVENYELEPWQVGDLVPEVHCYPCEEKEIYEKILTEK